MENAFNMKKEEFENIIKEQSNLKNLPNQKLVEFMDLLSSDFEATKENIINSTRYLDKVEELYNNTLKVYQERNNNE
jgi:flagellar motor switch protein FliG